MVSTRRSKSVTAGEGTNSDTAGEIVHGSQAEVSSVRHSKAAAVSGQAAAPVQLQPIEEELAAAADDIVVDVVTEVDAARQPEQRQQQQHAQRSRRRSQQQQQQASTPPPTAALTPAKAIAPSPAAAAAAAASAPDTDDEDQTRNGGLHGGADDWKDEDWDFDGSDMLQNLAATIRSALGSSKQQQPHRAPQTAVAAAGDEDAMEIDNLRWRPQTGLQLPRRVGQVVAAAAAIKQQPEEPLAAGPVVHNPAAAVEAGAAEAAAASAEGTEAVAVATKPKGLAKQLPAADGKEEKSRKKKNGPETAGKKWFDLPAVEITDEVKRDLRLLRLRGAYDPKRFYKSFDETKFPKHFAIGTVVDDPLDFYGGRLTQGQRKATLTEQLLADRELSTTRKKRYNKLQEEAQKWVKHKKRNTSQPRKTPAKHRPKH